MYNIDFVLIKYYLFMLSRSITLDYLFVFE